MSVTLSAARRRVVVWGPGELGSAMIRFVLDSEDLELVGVRAFSARKQGVDAGDPAPRFVRDRRIDEGGPKT